MTDNNCYKTAENWCFMVVDEDLLVGDEGCVYIEVVHKDFWNKNLRLDDNSFIKAGLQKAIPDFDLEEVMGSVFIFEGDVWEARKYCKSFGMTEH